MAVQLSCFKLAIKVFYWNLVVVAYQATYQLAQGARKQCYYHTYDWSIPQINPVQLRV